VTGTFHIECPYTTAKKKHDYLKLNPVFRGHSLFPLKDVLLRQMSWVPAYLHNTIW